MLASVGVLSTFHIVVALFLDMQDISVLLLVFHTCSTVRSCRCVVLV